MSLGTVGCAAPDQSFVSLLSAAMERGGKGPHLLAATIP